MKIEIIEPEQAQQAIDWSKQQLLYMDLSDGSRAYAIPTTDVSSSLFGGILIHEGHVSKQNLYKKRFTPAPKGTVIKITQE